MSTFVNKNPNFSKYKRLFVFDFETSGLNFESDRVIELGGLLFELNEKGKFEVVETIDQLIRINKPLSEKIIELTGITDEMLEKDGVGEETLFDILNKVYELDDVLFIAYNIQFDITFLNNLFKRWKNPAFEFEKDMLDVMAIYKDSFSYPHKLDNLVTTMGIKHKNTHRASDDCYATYLGFVEMVKRVTSGKIDPYINVVGYNPKYGVSGTKLEHIEYVPQYGARKEIIKRR